MPLGTFIYIHISLLSASIPLETGFHMHQKLCAIVLPRAAVISTRGDGRRTAKFTAHTAEGTKATAKHTRNDAEAKSRQPNALASHFSKPPCHSASSLSPLSQFTLAIEHVYDLPPAVLTHKPVYAYSHSEPECLIKVQTSAGTWKCGIEGWVALMNFSVGCIGSVWPEWDRECDPHPTFISDKYELWHPKCWTAIVSILCNPPPLPSHHPATITHSSTHPLTHPLAPERCWSGRRIVGYERYLWSHARRHTA